MKTNLRIIKKDHCGKISSPDEPTLTYHVGYDDSTKSLSLRVTNNSTGGLFSNEWISLDSILTTIEACEPGLPFKALVFKNLYQSKSANNHGFLSAVLRSEKILMPAEKQKLAHTKGDLKPFTTAMQKLIKAKTCLEDEVAIAEKAKEAKREELIRNMKKTAATSSDGK